MSKTFQLRYHSEQTGTLALHSNHPSKESAELEASALRRQIRNSDLDSKTKHTITKSITIE